jgi:hypothetical protein
MQIKHDLDFAGVLYWNLAGFPRLGTIGGLLLRLRRLEALDLSTRQARRMKKIKVRVAQSLEKWKVQVEQKTTREVKTRLDEWSLFLSECEIAPGDCTPEYPMKVEHRTIIELLKPHIAPTFAEESLPKLLQRADQRLKVVSIRAQFVWDEWFKSSFSRQDFWWLYVLPEAKQAA